jgi:hypothetical protein
MYILKHLRPILIVRGPDDRPDMAHPNAHPLVNLTSLAIGPIMNGELKDVLAQIKGPETDLDPDVYSNRPDHDWIGATSPSDEGLS